jgi:hypothetical protein
MVVGRGIMNMGRINVNPTITTLEISPDNLQCDGYAFFAIDVERVDMNTPHPNGTVLIINVDTGSTLLSGTLEDGYILLNKQMTNGAYNFAAIYNGIVNSFAPSQSTTIQYNVSFLTTIIHLTGPANFREDDGAEYLAQVTGEFVAAPTGSPSGYVIFTANDGYQITTLDIVPLLGGEATLKIDGGEIVAGSWIIGAQFISDGICYASSDIDTQNVLVT